MHDCWRDTAAIRASRPDKPAKINLFETPRFFADVYVLLPGQEQALHRHDGEDKCYLVLEGHGLVRVGGDDIEVEPGGFVFCEAGRDHGVRNTGTQLLRLLVFMAPHPRLGVSGASTAP